LANTLRAQGNLASARDDHRGAERFYLQAARLYVQVNDPLGLANTRGARGDVAGFTEDLQGARQLYHEAATLYERIHYRRGLAGTRLAEGRLAYRQFDLQGAAALCDQAALCDHQGLAQTHLAQALITVYLKQFDTAGELYEQAAALSKEVQDCDGLANALLGQGELAEFRSELERAEKLYVEEADRASDEKSAARPTAGRLGTAPTSLFEHRRRGSARDDAPDHRLSLVNGLPRVSIRRVGTAWP
jgi:tetratricopeptide (TPR) repeat protein